MELFNFLVKQRRYSNCIDTTVELINQLGIKIPTTLIRRELLLHPKYPSLLSITDALTKWNIENIATSTNTDSLKKIPLPAIAQIRNGNGHFVLIKEIGEFVTYFDSSVGIVIENISDFEKKWTGILLLVAVTSNSGDPNSESYKKERLLTQLRLLSIGVLILIPLLFLLITNSSFTIHVLLKILGIILTINLLLTTFGFDNLVSEAICGTNEETGCNKVVNSKMGKVMGEISLAEIGTLYYCGGLMVIMLDIVMGNLELNPILSALSLGAIPFTILSIHYQGRVLKTWCPLCLIVVALLWSEAALSQDSIKVPTSSQLNTFLIGVSLSTIAWMIFRPSFILASKYPKLERSLIKFTRSESIFNALLMNSKRANQYFPYQNDVVLGNPNSRIIITFVTNPSCGFCVNVHQVISSWLSKYGTNLAVVFRFVLSNNQNDPRNVVIRRIIDLSLHNQINKVAHALEAWFRTEGWPNLDRWLKEWECPPHSQTDLYMSKHIEWCNLIEVKSTPTLLFNGFIIPAEYSLEDFEYFLHLKVKEEGLSIKEEIPTYQSNLSPTLKVISSN